MDGPEPQNQRQKDSSVSSPVSHLLPFLVCLYHSKVSLHLLEAGPSPVRRWNEYGQATVYSPIMDGMDENLHAMLADSVKLNQAISSLVETKHVHQNSTENRTVSVFPETVVEQERLLTELGKLQYWRRQAVLFVERLFHENDAISPR